MGRAIAKVRIFDLPEEIRKRSILCCQNHLPGHPHFLPWVSLSSSSSSFSSSLFYSCSLQSISVLCSAPFYFLLSTLTPDLCRTTSPPAPSRGLQNRQINKLTPSQLGRVSPLKRFLSWTACVLWVDFISSFNTFGPVPGCPIVGLYSESRPAL